MSRKSPNHTPHEKAVGIIEQLVTKNLGGSLEATATCNQCNGELTINLVAGASSVSREKLMGTVRPDISLLDENGEPARFIEVVDSHAPEGTVHEQALQNGTEVVEIHLRAEREFTGRRRNKALDASLTVKARLQELAAGRLVIDAHNLLCRRPKCRECGTPLPLRTVMVRTKDCWNCGQNVNAATGDKDGEGLEQDYFTTEEIAFAQENGVNDAIRYAEDWLATALGTRIGWNSVVLVNSRKNLAEWRSRNISLIQEEVEELGLPWTDDHICWQPAAKVAHFETREIMGWMEVWRAP